MIFLSQQIPNITLENVNFSWPGGSKYVINNCNFSINKTGLWMIIGKNGCGKSTLFKLIQGILKPNKGKIDSSAKLEWFFKILIIKY